MSLYAVTRDYITNLNAPKPDHDQTTTLFYKLKDAKHYLLTEVVNDFQTKLFQKQFTPDEIRKILIINSNHTKIETNTKDFKFVATITKR